MATCYALFFLRACIVRGHFPNMLPHVASDTMMLVTMEIAAVVTLRFTVLDLFGIDIFDFHTAIGQIVAAIISVGTFVGIYKTMTSKGGMLKLGRTAVYGTRYN